MDLQVESKVGLEHMASRVWGFSEGADVTGACDWPAARLAEGQIGLCELRDGTSPDGWSGRLRTSHGGGASQRLLEELSLLKIRWP